MSTLLSIEALQTKADALAAEINAADPHLAFVYTIHNSGQLRSSLQMIEDTILDHPAGSIAALIMRRNFPPIEPSGLLGVAARPITQWLGLSTSTALLALVSINIDQYDDYFEALCDLYRYTWHGIEVADLCKDRTMLEKLGGRPMIPKRGPLGEARANLRADIFTCLMLKTEGYDDVIDVIGRKRARGAILRGNHDKPEKFPFVPNASATKFAADEILSALDSDRPRMAKCKDMTEEIALVETDDQIRQWWRFCEPAQDMAWRGYKPDVILAASLSYSDDPYVRSITHLIEDLSGIKAAEAHALDRTYNPFIDLHRNEQVHYALIDETFDSLLAQGVEEDSSLPLIVTASKQNQELLQGRFLGWCASALQSAALAFDQAALQGRPPAQAAQLEFQTLKNAAPIESLNKLTRDIITRQKAGEIVMLDQVPTLADGLPGLGMIKKSILETKDYLRKQTLDREISAGDLDMVLMPGTPTLAREFGNKMQPRIPAEVAFAPQISAPMIDFAPGSAPGLPPQIRRAVVAPDGLQPESSLPPRASVLSVEGDTGLSLDFDEALETGEKK